MLKQFLFVVLILSSYVTVFSDSSLIIEIDLVSTAINVVDGDTFDYLLGRIRLADIDAPESWEVNYTEAKNYLSGLVLNKTILIDLDDLGSRSGERIICLVYVKYNSTHLLNVNKNLVSLGYADFDDYLNNEFDPSTWTYYVEIGGLISNFCLFFEYGNVSVVYPSNYGSKPLGCGFASETDWLASAFVTSNLRSYTEGLDIDGDFVNQSSGKALCDYSCGIASFGGPLVNPLVKYSELDNTTSQDRAPIKFVDEGGKAHFRHANGTEIPDASLPWSHVNDDKDMFVIEVFEDWDGRYIMLCYGFGWKGTYAAGKYFDSEIYPDLESYPFSWVIVKWEDANGNGFVNTEADGDAYILIATG